MEKEEPQQSNQRPVEGSLPVAPGLADAASTDTNASGGKGARMTPEEIRAAATWARARGLATLHTATRKSASEPTDPSRSMDAST